MNAKQFVEQLRLAAPPVEELGKLGVTQAQIESTLARYSLTPRASCENTDVVDPLIDIISNYDVSKFNIGQVELKSNIEPRGNKLFLGYFEVDRLVLDVQTGEIQIEGYPGEGVLLWHCAENGDKFLDALVIAAKFLSRCGWDIDLYEDQSAHHEVAKKCTLAAGGDRYRDFYLVLCGCD